jgi:hypothetical protein
VSGLNEVATSRAGLAAHSDDLPVVIGVEAPLQEAGGTGAGSGGLKIAVTVHTSEDGAEQDAVPVNPGGSLIGVANCSRHDESGGKGKKQD